ncbi:MAG: ferrous iron transport protein A [Calditrichaeota bacterium]|nr:ferrous iron transport protein A [Calditrichota bacterium]
MRFRFGFQSKHRQTLECSPESSSAQHPADIITLNALPDGQEGQICGIRSRGRIARRLAEMGFTPGTTVQVVRRAPFTDPILLRIRGYLISLRREEAALIVVKHQKSN